jgi:chloramphenicol 3-O-phosphotransferase
VCLAPFASDTGRPVHRCSIIHGRPLPDAGTRKSLAACVNQLAQFRVSIVGLVIPRVFGTSREPAKRPARRRGNLSWEGFA